jgi:hypothetical protein
MTPKEKAEELLDKMKFNCRECDNDFKAKQCALIAVDEILFALKYDMNEPTNGSIKYWQEVKQEIEKL